MGMKRKISGFGLIELMLAILVSSVVMLAVYRYWIKGVQEMSESVKIAAIKARARRAFNDLVSDMKFIGYNPRAKRDPIHTDDNGDPLPFGFAQPSESPPAILAYDDKHLRPYEQLTFSFYTEESDPAYTTGLSSPIPACTDPYCVKSDYFLDNNSLKKRFWQPTPAGTFDQGSRQIMTLINNACIKFVFWDSDNNMACNCQDGRKCHSFSTACPDDPGDKFPTMMMLVMSVATNERYVSQFVTDGNCNDGKSWNSPCGCEDNDPNTACCDIRQASGSDFDKDKYIKFEKKIYLSNLH